MNLTSVKPCHRYCKIALSKVSHPFVAQGPLCRGEITHGSLFTITCKMSKHPIIFITDPYETSSTLIYTTKIPSVLGEINFAKHDRTKDLPPFISAYVAATEVFRSPSVGCCPPVEKHWPKVNLCNALLNRDGFFLLLAIFQDFSSASKHFLCWENSVILILADTFY